MISSEPSGGCSKTVTMMFDLPKKSKSPIIKVIGVGGGGSNAVNHMFRQGIVGVDFAICNTDEQAMGISPVPTHIPLGPHLTEGRGAGSKPNVGKLACEESIDEIRRYLADSCKMLFITAGMGGGTGTGAAPIIARTAKEMNILTVGIVTLPFTFEGRRRSDQGHEGLEELKKYVDTLIVISNDKLRQIHGNLSISEAFAQADNILTTAAKGIAEIITVPGYVNVDFEDVNTVMRNSGVAIMGTAMAEGHDRARQAVDMALHSPLLEDNHIAGARHILLNITSGNKEVTMDEIFEITEFVQEEAGHGTDLIWGNCYDESLGDKISVTIIATGFDSRQRPEEKETTHRVVVHLDDADEPAAAAERTPAADEPPARSGLSAIGFEEHTSSANTYEFDDVRPYDRLVRRPPVSDEPYIKDGRRDRPQQEMQRKNDRITPLQQPSERLSTPPSVSDFEKAPAYLRRGVKLDNVPDSAEVPLSRWVISDDDEPEIKTGGNSFLHDSVD